MDSVSTGHNKLLKPMAAIYKFVNWNKLVKNTGGRVFMVMDVVQLWWLQPGYLIAAVPTRC